MTATTTVTGSEDKAPVVETPRRGSLFTKIARPYKQSHGVQRFMLITGTALTILLILLAIFASLVAPYSFDASVSEAISVARVMRARGGCPLEPILERLSRPATAPGGLQANKRR